MKINWQKLLCMVGIHVFDWNVLEGAKVKINPVYVCDVWSGYEKCRYCSCKRVKTEIVHTQRKF